MNILSIDIETYSDQDITKVGAYRYVDTLEFEILLFAYAYDDEPVKIIDLAMGETIPDKIIKDLSDPNVIKSAFNANFERTALGEYFGYMSPDQWRCTMIKALTIGLPGSLDMVGKALHLPEDKQKLATGKRLIQYFCKPCKPTKANGGRTRNLPEHDPEKWELFKEYCIRDVESERDIRKKLDKFITTKNEQDLWTLDQIINDRGVNTDITVIEQAIKMSNEYTEMLVTRAKELTGLENPNSLAQLKKWIGDKTGQVVESITKDTIPGLIEAAGDNLEVKEMLELRQLMGKTSVKKYETMLRSRGSDGRIRGILQFYGANRTGRWAGRLVQVQNLPQNHIEDLEDARNYLKAGDMEAIDLFYDSIPDTLSQLIRTAFIPTEGNRFIVADFSAIEARVIAWYAKEKWRQDVFANNGDIYCASASKMFKVPVVKHGVNGHLRQKGKIAELALGYGGAGGAIRAFDKAGSIPDEELPKLVSDWREASPNIVNFWWDVDKAAKMCIRQKKDVKLDKYNLIFKYAPGLMFLQLPSGRSLAYVRPKITKGKFDNDVISYEGMEQTSKQWKRLETYGPKLVENIVQATARDCLGITMQRITQAGYDIVFHVHDELILDVPKEQGSLEEVNKIFGVPIPWAPGLILNADGYECNFYMKD